MCLHVIDRRVKPTNEIHVGWKVFRKVKGKIHFLFMDDAVVKIGKWMKAIKRNENTYFDEGYKTGFHIFTSRQDARDYLWYPYKPVQAKHGEIIRRVQYRKLRLIGTEVSIITVVADEMMVLPLRKRKN